MGFLRLLRRFRARLQRRRRERERVELAQQLAATRGYSHTTDYVSGNLENWTRILGPCAGREVKMLEIGSYEGRSTVWFLENILTQEDAEITCVDIFSEPRWELRFDHNIRVSGLGRKLRKLKGRSEDLLPGLPRASYDVIYVDGSHEASAVLMDALLSWTLLKPGGLLLFDDYRWEPEKNPSQRPQMAIDLFLESFAGRFELVHQDYQVVIRKMKPLTSVAPAPPEPEGFE